ncbi:MAG: DegT/DnrJ/EryC1/StrS family aminotransferase [Candidatus Diapherotrites archaeon]
MIPIAKPIIGEKEKKLVMEVIESGMLVQGKYVQEFEEKFAEYLGVKNCVAVTNGTQALICALKLMDLKGEVLVPSFSFIASANAVIEAGLKPVFVEVDKETFCINLYDAEKKVSNKTCAIMPVHLFGHSCQMLEVNELAENYSLKIIEDACQAHGAEFKGKKVGSFGDAGAFSFYPTKNITMGEGGVISTNDDALAEKIRVYRNQGMVKRYHHDAFGLNFRITNIAGAIGLGQMDKIEEFIEKRRKNAEYLNKGLEGVQTPVEKEWCRHSYNQYTIKTNERELLEKKLIEKQIGHMIYYPIPIHQQKIIEEIYGKNSMPVTEKLAKEVISLPVHPALTKEQLDEIIEAVNGFRNK